MFKKSENKTVTQCLAIQLCHTALGDIKHKQSSVVKSGEHHYRWPQMPTGLWSKHTLSGRYEESAAHHNGNFKCLSSVSQNSNSLERIFRNTHTLHRTFHINLEKESVLLLCRTSAYKWATIPSNSEMTLFLHTMQKTLHSLYYKASKD